MENEEEEEEDGDGDGIEMERPRSALLEGEARQSSCSLPPWQLLEPELLRRTRLLAAGGMILRGCGGRVWEKVKAGFVLVLAVLLLLASRLP